MTDITAALQDAVLAAVSHTTGQIVTRFVLCAEVIEPEGDQALITIVNHGASKWDTLGMLDFAATVERNSIEGQGDL